MTGDAFPRGELTDIVISTRTPGKWRFVDLGTHEVWWWDEVIGRFSRAEEPYPEMWRSMNEDPDAAAIVATSRVDTGPQDGHLYVDVRRRSLSESMDWIVGQMDRDPSKFTATQLALQIAVFADMARELEKREATPDQEREQIERLRTEVAAGVALADIGASLPDVLMDYRTRGAVKVWTALYVPRRVTGYGLTEDDALAKMVERLSKFDGNDGGLR